MDIEHEDIQFLGFFGILKESFKIIFSWREIFTQITLALILPLSFIFLAHFQVSQLIFSKILHNEDALDQTRAGTPVYTNISDLISSEWAAFWLFKGAYFTFLLIFSLLSTSAVVYTVASIYTAKDTTFKKVMVVVPKVWKRLMVTFIWNFIIIFCYNAIALVFLTILAISVGFSTFGIVVLALLLIIYLIGFVYISIVWQLASVISVLEDVYGIQAMIKSKVLIRGNMGVAVLVFILINVGFILVQLGFEKFVVLGGDSYGAANRLGYGILCLLLLCKLMLFGLVVQTVFYFVCKSYHNESIDKSLLANHLEVYQFGDYVPLKSKDVQLEQFHV